MEIREESGSGPLLALIGFSAAALFGFVALPLAAPGRFANLTSVEYRTWQVLIVLQAWVWILAVAYTVRGWRRVRSGPPFPWPAWAAVLLAAVLAAIPFLIDQFFGSVTGYDWSESEVSPRGKLPLVAGSCAGLVVVVGMVRIHVLAEAWLEAGMTARKDVAAYRELSTALERHLLLLGGILAGFVIGTQASRKAILAIEEVDPIRDAQIWQMAVYWSALVAVIYMGSRGSIRRVGLKLRDVLVATSGAGQEASERLERERDVSAALGLDRSYLAELQSILGVLTPIAGAVASQLL